jgi:hypothetical protein
MIDWSPVIFLLSPLGDAGYLDRGPCQCSRGLQDVVCHIGVRASVLFGGGVLL